MNAGDPRTGQELREALLGRGCAQWHPVQNDLIAGSTEQQSGFPALIQRRAQFLPGSFELRRRAHMSKFIQARELQ
jgi:hypothetical protein